MIITIYTPTPLGTAIILIVLLLFLIRFLLKKEKLYHNNLSKYQKFRLLVLRDNENELWKYRILKYILWFVCWYAIAQILWLIFFA
jgi:hypothetical protein